MPATTALAQAMARLTLIATTTVAVLSFEEESDTSFSCPAGIATTHRVPVGEREPIGPPLANAHRREFLRDNPDDCATENK